MLAGAAIACLATGCSAALADYDGETRLSILTSNAREEFGTTFWYPFMEDVSVDGDRAVAVTSNVLVSSRICGGLALSALDEDGLRVVGSIEVRDEAGNTTFECSTSGG